VLDGPPPRLDTPRLFPAPAGGLLNLDNFRRREWALAVRTSAPAKPARIYDLRSTYASKALAAGVTVFELAGVMGTSVRMIEKHYGTLLEGAHARIAFRLAALGAELEEADEAERATSRALLGHGRRRLLARRAKRNGPGAGTSRDGSDGTRTRDLRRDSSAPCFAARTRRSPLVARCAAFPSLALAAFTTGCHRCVPRTFQNGCAEPRFAAVAQDRRPAFT
jgi:hypothetical protein